MERLPNDEREQNIERKQKRKKVGRRVLAVVLTFICFFAGVATCWLVIDPEMRSLIRLKDRIQASYYQEITDEQFYDTLFGAVNREILDDYSLYMTAEEYRADKSQGEGNRSGLGIAVLSEDADGNDQMLITRVYGNSPAEKAGLAELDRIVGFGLSESDMTYTNDYQAFKSFLTARESGESFYLSVQTESGRKTVTIAKGVYVENYVFYRTNRASYRLTGDDADDAVAVGKPLACLDDDTAYIRLTQFNGDCADEMEGAMELFKKQNKKHLVLDLRDNVGGYMDDLQEIAGYFCKNATGNRPAVAVADYGEKKQIFESDKNEYRYYFSEDSRIYVLADTMTASASECLIGCMLDYGTIEYGDICLSYRGEKAKTYGKGIMQTAYPVQLLKGDAVRLTTATIHWPVSSRCIHGRGVLPEDGAKTVAESYGDAEIENAINALKGV